MHTPILFRWLGIAGIELKVGGRVLVIDPFFTRPPLRWLWFGRVEPSHALIAEKITECNYVLVTHAHWDHVMDVPDVVRNTSAVALGSANTCQLLSVCGIPEGQMREVERGDIVELGSFRVEALPAEHMRTPGFTPGSLSSALQPPLRLRDYRMDKCFSFLIEVEGVRLLNWCSVRTEPASRAEVLFVGPEKSRGYYEALLSTVQPRLVIPVHWDDLFRPPSAPTRPFFKPPRWAFPPLQRMDMDGFRQMIESIVPEAQVFLPEVFEVYDLYEVIRVAVGS
jgi:L-ascorbate metabolism protein UlaG (beta-lactamase superfamily)